MILLVGVKLVKQVLDECIVLRYVASSFLVSHHRNEITHTLPICPSSPPTNPSEGPPTANWCEHESVLSSSTSETVGGEALGTWDICCLGEGSDDFLGHFGSHMTMRLYRAVDADGREQEVFRSQGPSNHKLVKVDPIDHVLVKVCRGHVV